VEVDLRLLEETGLVAVEIAGLRLEALPSAVPRTDPGPAAGPPLRRETLLAAAAGERVEMLQAHLRKHFADALGLAEPRLDVTVPLHCFGLDSLMVFKLGRWLEGELGVRVRLADLVAGPSVAALAQTVIDTMVHAEH
jgi:aryl carrier-like protein